MDGKELAEKMVRISGHTTGTDIANELTHSFESLLEDELEEWGLATEQAVDEAYERAAQVAESHKPIGGNPCGDIAAAIRKLGKGGE